MKMTKSILFTLFFAMVTLLAAQDAKYYQTMGKTIEQLFQAQAPGDFDPVLNTFARIGEAEKNQWEPYYYLALGHTFKSFRLESSTDKDAALEMALKALANAEKVSPNNSEILALQGFVYMIQISVDPASRGQMLSGKAMGLFGKAMAIDPTNPRAAMFMAQMQIGTAQFFGTSIDEPCGLVQQSVTLFDTYQPASPIAPMWGKESVGEYLKMCDSAESK